MACQYASRGLGLRVIGIDAGSKRELSLECGAEIFIDHTEGKVAEEVKAATGGLGAHAVIVLTAANAAYASAMSLLRFAGTLVAIGIPEGKPEPIAGAFPQSMIGKETKIVGVAVGNRQDAIETLQFADRGLVKLHYRIAKMEELTQVFEEMHRGELKGRVVLDLTS